MYYFGLPFILLFLVVILGFYKNQALEADNRMKVIIDRFEGDYAVVELPDKTTVDMSLKLLEPGTKEGDIIEIKVLEAETKARRNKANQILNEVFEK